MTSMSKINVDPVKCIGCGLCVSVAEEVFRMNDQGKSEVLEKSEEKSDCETCGCCGGVEEKVKEAIEVCPVKAISQE